MRLRELVLKPLWVHMKRGGCGFCNSLVVLCFLREKGVLLLFYIKRAGYVRYLCCSNGGKLIEFSERGNKVVFDDAAEKNMVGAEVRVVLLVFGC